MKKPYGKLIGASLGPGDPELITRRSWAVLQSDARWIYPVKKAAEVSYALSIVERSGLPIPADAVELVFPMTRDAELLAKAWLRAAEQTVALLAEGRDLVFLVEGDASTFATFGHLARVARELAPEIEVETIPGVSSLAAAAATTGMPLAEEDETLATEAQRALSAQGVDNAAVNHGKLAAGAPKAGPYDVIVLQGAAEVISDSLVSQLKEGGRIGALFMEGNLGVARVGYKIDGRITWRQVFNASAPVLPGFEMRKAFAL